jgi:hypothetical protein
MTKIYESPDGGKTVYERESGSTSRTRVETSCGDYGWLLDDFDDTVSTETVDDDITQKTYDWLADDTIDVSSLSVSSSSISSGSIILKTNNPTPTDIRIHDENGKEYSFRNMFDRLDTIEKRLTILRPDDKMLEKYELLQSLYDQYKAAEALLYGEEDDSEN